MHGKRIFFFHFRNPKMDALIILCSIYSINAVGAEQMTKPNKSKKTQQKGRLRTASNMRGEDNLVKPTNQMPCYSTSWPGDSGGRLTLTELYDSQYHQPSSTTGPGLKQQFLCN